MRVKSFISWAIAFGVIATVSLQGANVYLTWQPSLDVRTSGYQIWFAQSGGNFSVRSVGLRTNVTIGPLSPSQFYFFKVCAVDASGIPSAFTSQIMYMIPPLPAIAVLQPPPVVFTPSGVSVTPGASITVAPGATVNFGATVSSSTPVSYQWNFRTAPLDGATSAALFIMNVSTTNAGVYNLVVSNSSGCVTSSPISLTVVPIQAGTYNGLFYQTNSDGSPAIALQSAGMVANCVVNASGVYSGRIYLGHAGYVISGKFDPYGNSEIIVSVAANGQSNLDVQLHLNSTALTGQLTGTISNMDPANPWVSSLQADSSTPGSLLGAVVDAELILPMANLSLGQVFLATLLGQIYVSGDLADGTLFTENIPVSAAGRAPLYASLYNGLGLIEGWMNLSNGVPSGTVTWLQEAGAKGSLYPHGFTNVLGAILNQP